MTRNFKYISLFSGIGGFEHALDALGGECVLASEFDKKTNHAYSLIFGEETKGDVTKIEAEDVPAHDVLVGGFPCQAFSSAGARRGFEDTRGTLFFEVARIAKHTRPKLMLLENVKGLLTHDAGNTVDVIISTLNEIGYVVSLHLVDSLHYGTAQKRERLLMYCLREDIAEALGVPILTLDSAPKGTTIIYKTIKRLVSTNHRLFAHEEPEKQEPPALREFLENVPKELYLTKEEVEERLPVLTTKENITFIPGDLTDEVYARLLDETTILRPLINVRPKKAAQRGKRVRPAGSPMFTITSLFPQGVIFEVDGKIYVRELQPSECLRLQRFPERVIDILTKSGEFHKSTQYRFAGNAVTVSTIENFFKSILEAVPSEYLENRKVG